jgi:3-methyladenine DNA glycosylase AlkC
MTEKVLAKDRALNADRIARIGRQVKAVLPIFDADAFAADVMADLPRLELKARIARTAKGLHDHLPVTGAEALQVLLRSLPPTPQAAGVTNDFGLHLYSPHSDYVARYCRNAEDLVHSLDALRRFTSYFSAEDAVRYFLNDFPEQTMKAVHAWARDGDYRVRRLASESTRPTLPWSPRISLPVDAGLPVLDQLHCDSSRYVTQSVANHLRDIAATDPDLVLATLTRWKVNRRAGDKEFDFIAREALKTKLKEGWPPAYVFLGYASDAPVDVSALRLERTQLHPGETLVFHTDLSTRATAPLHVTYVIASTTQRGARREKVYFLSRVTAEPGRPIALTKEHLLRATGTAAVRPGAYAVEIQVNGRRFPAAEFQVLEHATPLEDGLRNRMEPLATSQEGTRRRY